MCPSVASHLQQRIVWVGRSNRILLGAAEVKVVEGDGGARQTVRREAVCQKFDQGRLAAALWGAQPDDCGASAASTTAPLSPGTVLFLYETALKQLLPLRSEGIGITVYYIFAITSLS